MNMVKANQSNWIEDERVKLLRRDVRRLRRALMDVRKICGVETFARCNRFVKECHCPLCMCKGIATRALKGKG